MKVFSLITPSDGELVTIRRTTLITAATVLALSAVAACDNGDDARSAPSAASAPASPGPTASATPSATAAAETPTPTPTATPTATAAATPTATGAPVDATGAFDPAVALANADPTPYAATETMKTTATANGQGTVLTQTGRINFNTPAREGRSETKMVIIGIDEPTLWMDTVKTGEATFIRDRTKPDGAWISTPLGGDKDTRGDSDGIVFAKLLVAAGPAARKGMEQKSGVAAFHLGARLTAAQIKAVDPGESQKMTDKGINSKDYDVWIDRAGRVVAETQSMKVPREGTTVTSVITTTYTDFGPRETFPAPATTTG